MNYDEATLLEQAHADLRAAQAKAERWQRRAELAWRCVALECVVIAVGILIWSVAR